MCGIVKASFPRSLSAETRIAGELDVCSRKRMFELYAAHYRSVSRELFLHDLANKDWVVVLRDGQGLIQGFSSVSSQDFEAEEAGGRIRVLFSGDTVINRAYWGTQALAFEWLRFAGEIRARKPTPLYWLLISKGHRTYRYLSTFSLDYWPRHDRTPPDAIRRLKDRLALTYFGHYYDPQRGVLSFGESRGELAPDLAQIPAKDLSRPEVAFFLSANPGYSRGEELVCLTELSPTNLKPLARRIFLAGVQGVAAAQTDKGAGLGYAA